MNKILTRSVLGGFAAMMVAAALLTSCGPAGAARAVPAGSAAAAAPSEIGRYQMVVVTDAARGTVVMMIDTREGATWIYRPPQGSAINGFWSDVPRLTYAPEFWRNVFAQQPAAPATGAVGGTPPASTPAPAPSR